MIPDRILNILIGVFIITIVLLAAFLPKFTPATKRIQTLFTSQLNITLLVLLVFFVTVLNPMLGVILGFMIMALALFVKNSENVRKIEAFLNLKPEAHPEVPMPEGAEGFRGSEGFQVDAGLLYQNPRTAGEPVDGLEIMFREGGVAQGFEDIPVSSNTGGDEVADEKNNLALINNNKQSSQPTTMSYAPVNYQMTQNALQAADANHLNQYLKVAAGATSCQNNNFDFLTQKGPNDSAGWDTVGCRYDTTNSGQNSSTYGPPLAWCATYDTAKLTKCGTLFYPLNG